MADDSQTTALNDTYHYNSMLARALTQLMPEKDRKNLKLWFDKFHTMNEYIEDMVLRNDYMWFILLMLQTGKVREPFNQPPPNVELGPLKEIMPFSVYEEVLVQSDRNTSMAFKSSDELGEEVDEDSCQPNIGGLSPSTFIYNQPIPLEGVICYMAAFSDQPNDN